MIPLFLDPREIARGGAEAELAPWAVEMLQHAAARIAADAQQTAAMADLHRCIFDSHEEIQPLTERFDPLFGDDAQLMHALLILDTLRLVRERQAARGAPPELAPQVNRRHGIAWLQRAFAQPGSISDEDWMPGWFRTVASGNLYRLGRLEFIPKRWAYPFRVYRHRRDATTVVLVEDGESFTEQGYLVGEPTWKATLQEDETAIIGMPISPLGHALREPIRLARDEWDLVLGQGQYVLDMHIPEHEPMTLDLLRDAMEQAEVFFPRYYPDMPFVAYTCDSWVFSPFLSEMLQPQSNILRWHREGYLMPAYGGVEWLLLFVFGSKEVDVATAPRDTQLRRAVLERLEQGLPLFCGLYMLLRQDLPRFGTQPYRTQA